MTELPRQISVLHNATLTDGSRCDVEIIGATVSAVLPAGTAVDYPGQHSIDLTGFVLLTAPAEPHAHLDKALSFDAINPPMGDLGLAIESWRAYAVDMTCESIADRARRQALLMLQQGTTSIRSHIDLLRGADPLRGVRALVRVRAELAGLLDLELVALAGPDTPDDVVEEALDLGVDLVGGAPHLAPHPVTDLTRLLSIAFERGVGVDLHTDESLHGELTIGEFARQVRDWPASHAVTASHCVRLGTLSEADLAEIIAQLRASRISVVTLPITNLYLQGWEDPISTPRGLTAVRALIDAGVTLAAGADNVRDPFNPVGRSDALETASLLVTAAHLTPDEAYALVSSGARKLMKLPVAGVCVGAAADLLAVRGNNLSTVVANAPADRFVIHAGRLVAKSRVESQIALPAHIPAHIPPRPLLAEMR